MPALIRLATPEDAPGVQAIYAPYVLDTAISFELEPPSVGEMAGRIAETLAYAPWLVCEGEGGIVGYAYASRFKSRAAYRWTTEVTMYVHPGFHRRGVARALYTALLGCLRASGYRTAIAVIALPNAASVAAHEGFQFRSVGVCHGVGNKFGVWHDTGWWELPLQDLPAGCAAPIAPETAARSPAWGAALRAGSAMVGNLGEAGRSPEAP